jgi:hypothetical protein
VITSALEGVSRRRNSGIGENDAQVDPWAPFFVHKQEIVSELSESRFFRNGLEHKAANLRVGQNGRFRTRLDDNIRYFLGRGQGMDVRRTSLTASCRRKPQPSPLKRILYMMRDYENALR